MLIIGNLVVPGTCAATSLLWLREHEPVAYRECRCLGFTNTFVLARLTGQFVTDTTNSALSGIVDMRRPDRWSDQLLDAIGLDSAALPRIVRPWEVVGAVGEHAAVETGIPKGTPVVCGCGDSISGSFGAGVIDPQTVAYVSGSTDCLLSVVEAPTDDRRWLNCASVVDDRWIAIGATTSSGVSLEWCGRLVLAEASLQSRADLHRGLADLYRSCGRSTSRVLFLPYLQGERTPVWDPLARGMFVGLSSGTTKGDLVRAVLEGTAFAVRDIVECRPGTDACDPIEIRAMGGGTKNHHWNQIKADVLGRPLEVLEFEETSSLGAALCAGIGVGVFRNPGDAAAAVRREYAAHRVDPDEGRGHSYDELYGDYRRLYGATRDIMHRLATRE